MAAARRVAGNRIDAAANCILCNHGSCQHRRSGRIHGAGDARPRSRAPGLELVAVGSDSLAGRTRARSTPDSRRLQCPGSYERGRARARGGRDHRLSLARGGGRNRDPSDGRIVVDLSGAHRLQDAALYEAWYGFTHPRPESLGDWVYGLPELVARDRPADRESRVVTRRRRFSRSSRFVMRSSPAPLSWTGSPG